MQLLINLLKDEIWGMDAAKAFQVLSSENELLNKSNHAIIRLLHKQRFFMFVFPQIVSSASSQTISSGSLPIPSFIGIFSYNSDTIELSDSIIKHNIQHSERDSSPRTSHLTS